MSNRWKRTQRTSESRGRALLWPALAAGALLLLPTAALAQPGPGRGQGGPGWGRGPCGKGGGGPGMRGGGPGMRGGGPGMRGGGPGGPFMRGDLERLKQHLNLTAAQVRKIEALRKIHPAAMAKIRLEKQRIRAQMRVEWLKDRPSTATLRSLHNQLLGKEQTMAKARFEVRLQIAAMLTAEQRTKLRARRGFGGFGRGFGRGGGFGPGFGRGGGGGW